MATGFILLIIAMMKLFPTLPVSRLLHRTIVELPLLKLATMDRRHVIFGVALLVMLVTASEMIMLLGSADVAILLAWDVSIYLDAVLAIWTLAAVTRSKAAWQSLAGILTRPFRGARRRAPRRRREGGCTAANDSEEGPGGYALAA